MFFKLTNVSKAFLNSVCIQTSNMHCDFLFISFCLWVTGIVFKMSSLVIKLKVVQAEAIFPLLVKQKVFFLRLLRQFQGPWYLLNIIGSFGCLESKPILFIKMLTTCIHGSQLPGCSTWFFSQLRREPLWFSKEMQNGKSHQRNRTYRNRPGPACVPINHLVLCR